jgi:hypothetical protein
MQSQSLSYSLTKEQTIAVKAELQAILRSEGFAGSNRCCDFLEFVVTRALAGDRDSLTERFIGVGVFGRDVDYETATDAIVRVRANDVRRRLAQYYSNRQDSSAIRIDLIPGGYVPEFHWRAEAAIADAFVEQLPLRVEQVPVVAISASPIPMTATEAVPARRSSSLFWWSSAAAIAIASIAIVLLLKSREDNFDRFWRPVLQGRSSPVLVLPVTNTFQIASGSGQKLEGLKMGESVTITGGELQELHNWHISLPVFQATLSVFSALQRKGQTPVVRMGADLTRDELRGHPVIAIGSFSNPWTQENVSGLRFTFDRGASDKDSPRIRDARNPQRTWSLPSVYPEPQNKDYAIVTRTFDPVTHEQFVSLAGLHSFGNQIAGEFVSQDSSWDAVAARAPRGWDQMNLQILLEADIVGTTPGSPRIVDMYFWK